MLIIELYCFLALSSQCNDIRERQQLIARPAIKFTVNLR